MKRDMALIYYILDYAEKNLPYPSKDISLPELDSYTSVQIEYHVGLCGEHDLLDIVVNPYTQKPEQIRKINWSGHDELDRLRREGYG